MVQAHSLDGADRGVYQVKYQTDPLPMLRTVVMIRGSAPNWQRQARDQHESETNAQHFRFFPGL